jgi:CDP-glucose 4,6-dehydratase
MGDNIIRQTFMEQNSQEKPLSPVNPRFWWGRRVLVTGHTGFKGSWVSLMLHHMGAQVVGYSLEHPSQPNLFTVARVGVGFTDIRGDIREYEPLLGALKKAQPEIVIHMAAQSLVRPSYEDPIGTYEVNVMGTVNLLQAIRQVESVRGVVLVTSDKCYENREWHWGYRENDPMGGYDPYSNSKGCAELVVSAFRNSFFNASHPTQIASVRAGNVIGGGDWGCDRLVPDAMGAFMAGDPLMVRYPLAVRPWQHVLDPLNGYLALAQRLVEEGAAYAQGWNFGPGAANEKSVGYLVRELVRLWGGGAEAHFSTESHPHEAGYLKLDSSKAHALLDWQPQIILEEALRLTVDWTRGYAAGREGREMILEQIENYG